MATVPTFNVGSRTKERPAFQTSLTTRASADDFGAGIGRGMQQVGQGLAQASEAMSQLAEVENATAAKDRETKLADWQREAAYGENGFMTLSGGTAVAARDDYYRQLGEKQREFGEGLSPGARQYYLRSTDALTQSAKESAAVHTARERKAWYTDAGNARLTMAADDALAAWQQPGKVAQSLQLGLDELNEQSAMLGWSPDVLAEKKQQFTSVVTAGITQRLAQEDPIAAAEYLFANADKLTADDGFVLSTKLLPLIGDAAGREAFETGAAGPMIAPGTGAADVLRFFEGFESKAYWDTNAWRTGYGSDTVTKADGTVVRVTKDTVITRPDAERDLERRLGEFQIGIVNDIGEQAWGTMDAATQAGLTSVSYNYGSLPSSVVAAVATGHRVAIAAAVEALGSHNGGVNAGRRAKEAALIRNGTGAGVQFSPRVEAVLDKLPANSSVLVREAAAQEMIAQQTAATAVQKAEYEAHKGALTLGILTGDVASEQTILGDNSLADDDKATLLRSFRSEQEGVGQARNYLTGLADGSAPVLNPFASDDQAIANRAFDQLTANVPREAMGATVTEFVAQSGMIPKQLVAGVRQGLASTDTNQVAQSMSFAAMLVDKAPIALGAIENGKEIQDAAAAYAELVGNQGMSLEQAAYHMVQQRLPENVAKADVLKDGWNRAVKDDLFKVSDVLAVFDTNPLPGGPAAGGNPYMEAALTSDYLRAAESAFNGAANGDANLARTMALAEIKRTYGVTRISGSEVVTKFPPEKFYPAIDGSHDYVRDLAMSDARSVNPEAVSVMLVAGPETAQDVRAGKPPRYNLMFTMPDGVQDMAPGLFVVDQDSIADLSTLDSEERQIKFEMGRLYEQAMRARQNDPMLSTIERTMGGMITPQPADVVPGYDEYEARLLDIDLRRRNALGQNATGATVMTREQLNPSRADMEAEAAWAAKNAETFGTMGGTP